MNKYKKGLTAGIIGIVATVTVLFYPQHIDLKSHNVQGLVLHCSATRENQKNVTAKTINDYHTLTKKERVNPYNAIVEYNGNVVWYRKWNSDSTLQQSEKSWGSAEYNICCYNICYVGGMDSAYKHPKNTLTKQQDSALKVIVFDFLKQYPKAYIIGHNQLVNKACPSFNTVEKCIEWGVPINNIWKFDVDKYSKQYEYAIKKVVK